MSMINRRNSSKRAKSTSSINVNNSNKRKKISLDNVKSNDDEEDDGIDKSEEEIDDFEESLDDTDQDSDYRPNDNGESDSDNEDNATESKFFKSNHKLSINRIKNISDKFNKTDKVLKSKSLFNKEKSVSSGHNIETDSSSDEFERAPLSLEELGDFKKINSSIKKNEDDNLSDNNDNNIKMETSDYFDFTQIIERQELIKSVATLKNDNKKEKSSPVIRERKCRTSSKLNNKKLKIDNTNKETKDLNVMDLLKLGEGTSNNDDYNNTDYDDTEDNIKKEDNDGSKGIQVTIELPGVKKCSKEKKKHDIEAAIKRRFNLIKKDNQVFAHKVHLLCWIAHGNYVNNLLNSSELLCIALSLIPSKHCYPPKRCDLNYLEQFVEWFVNKIKLVDVNSDNKKSNAIKNKQDDLLMLLKEQFNKQVTYSKKHLALLFVCIVRSLGLTCRLLINLRPVPLKPPQNELFTVSNYIASTSNTNDKKRDKKSTDNYDEDKKKDKKETKRNSSKYFTKNTINKKNKNEEDNKNIASTSNNDKKNNSRRRQPNDNKITNIKKSNNKITKVEEKVEMIESDEEDENSKSDSDFEINRKKKGRKSKVTDNKTSNRHGSDVIDRRVLSSDDSDNDNKNILTKKKKKNATDEWAEVYLEAEEKWISVDLVSGKIHCAQHLYGSATHPVTYVLGWDNDNAVKDLTRRYVPHWMTITKKMRIEPDWWDETMRPFAAPRNARNREEDEELDKQLEDQPLPSSISEFKNHPLYALKRHLLKFQAIYPPDAPTVGFIKNEPVYSRTCVVELHTRESWIKEAKCVRIGEEPYKIVKARPKYDKMTGQVIKDLPLHLFGYWQVTDYIPPPAVDGKVPRNEYGNVELYKPCMLPAGTVHLQLPGLNRVAKKLNIDCAPAVVGWDFHSGSSHPVMDGFIVCEEFKDSLLDAWNQDIDDSVKRAKEKVEQRVYGNWKRLIKGLLIRERLKLRYGFEAVPEVKPKGKSTKKRTK
ncbi:DNA repair protein complementing XP-C cells homolog [Lycorma delicatula]|uniref:DNA repair protein complementing XP-C cells homolog n=1 Tax=Lycorma delicatula TaxID=130591 RepID=UPI003F514D38